MHLYKLPVASADICSNAVALLLLIHCLFLLSMFVGALCLLLHPIEFIFLNLSDLLECLAILLTSALAKNC